MTHAFFALDDQAAYNASENLTPPKSREEAMKRSDWKQWEEAEQIEVGRLKKRGTFKGPMKLPIGQKALPLHFVYTYKIKDGIPVYKARLVAGAWGSSARRRFEF